jgi:two-component system response regulator YesN
MTLLQEMIRAVIVDDEDLSRYAIRKLLSDSFGDVSVVGEAVNGQEAVQLVRELRPDLVIMDVRLPGLDGLEASRRIARIHQKVRIIIVSAYDDFSYAQKALNLGLAGYMLKPVTEEDISGTLSRVLEEIRSFHRVAIRSGAIDPVHKAGIGPLLTRGTLLTGGFMLTGGSLLSGGSGDDEAEGNPGSSRTRQLRRRHEPKELPVEASRVLERLVREAVLRGDDLSPAASRALVDAWVAEDEAPQALRERLSDFFYSVRSRLRDRGMQEMNAEPLLPLVQEAKDRDGVQRSLRTFLDDLHRVHRKASGDLDQSSRFHAAADALPLSELSLERLAADLDLSPEHVSRTFKDYFSENFVDYATRRRIDAACRLLREERLGVDETASRVGYVDTHYFTKVFKKRTGFTPGEWQRLS